VSNESHIEDGVKTESAKINHNMRNKLPFRVISLRLLPLCQRINAHRLPIIGNRAAKGRLYSFNENFVQSEVAFRGFSGGGKNIFKIPLDAGIRYGYIPNMASVPGAIIACGEL
jgi:hypothetical protein